MKRLKFVATFAAEEKKDYSVPVTEMKPGQIGVMTRYRRGGEPLGPSFEGRVVCWGWRYRTTDCLVEPMMLMDLIPATGTPYGEHRLGGPDLGTRVRILKDGDTLVAGKDGALTVKWAEKPKEDRTIPVRDLEPGQVGVITGWKYPQHIGTAVVRTSSGTDRLQMIGDANGWDPVPAGNEFRVRPLGPGDRLDAVECEDAADE